MRTGEYSDRNTVKRVVQSPLSGAVIYLAADRQSAHLPGTPWLSNGTTEGMIITC